MASQLIICDISEVLLELGLGDVATDEERGIVSAALRGATTAVIQCLEYNPVKAERTEYYPQIDMRRGDQLGIWEANDNEAYIRQVSEASTDELQLKHIPIRLIDSLFVDYDGRFGKRPGSFAAETEKVEGRDFWASYDQRDSSELQYCSDGILRAQGLWPCNPGSVKVVYTAGYSTEELHGQDDVVDASAILEAVKDETTRRVLKINSRKKKRLAGFSGPLASESLGDYSYSVNTTAFDRLINGGMDLLPETIQKLQKFRKMDWGVQ